jgi:hypothetical protein
MFTLPTNFVSDIGSSTTGVLSALGGTTTLIIGVLLATLVITLIINALRHH